MNTMIKSIVSLSLLLGGMQTNVQAQYDDNDNQTETKIDKSKANEDRDDSKRIEVIQKSLEKKKGIQLGDTVYYMGKPNCLYIIEKKFLGSTIQATCKALNGKEAFWLNFKTNEYLPNNDPNKRYYEIVFVASNAKIHYQGSENRKFCAMTNSTTINSGTVVYQNNVPSNPNNPYGKVERNRSGMIQAQGNQIIQDGQVIGTFNQFKQATNGTIQNEITFYLPNGSLIARCTAYGATSHNFNVITTVDNRNIEINTGMITEAQDLSRYLVNNGYM